ncbi:RNA polymerase sigma factor [Amycolatopsis sp. cg5]|uniref:RNA polymerase sigma factor n=1 Tax=Amycolatopsis sp. cg5 TaxID=3238802 RepID=UPI003525ABD0
MVNTAEVADDLTQETWVAVLRGLPRLKEAERFAPWLFTIARRSLMNRLREEYRVPPEPELVADDDPVLDRVELLAGLAGLPLVEREVLVLVYLLDLALADCATVLGVPAGTVKSRLFRARGMLRARLAEKGFQHD